MAKTILILAANPKNTSRLRLDEEVREILAGLQRAPRGNEFRLETRWAVRPSDVRRALLDYEPNIVHFCGHGAGEDGIVLEDDAGQAKLVGAEALAGLFKLFADSVECVVLNACYSEVQAAEIAKHIPYVIGVKKDIGDPVAIEFAVAFYDALGAGKSVDFAYEIACNSIRLVGFPEEMMPIIYHNPSLSAPNSDQARGEIGLSLNIMVTGGKEATSDVLRLAFLVGQYVIFRGHTLISSGSSGVDKASAEGARAACQRKNLDARVKIQVFRPLKAPIPDFDFGGLQIVGQDYAERRGFVVQRSDALILLGGRSGTRKIARQAQIAGKPIIPIGIGGPDETAVQLWYKIGGDSVNSLPIIPIQDEDRWKIGPGQRDFEEVALNAVLLAEKLVRQTRESRKASDKRACVNWDGPKLLISAED
ncbi:MAG: CHAT domain-containing protein [Candidatus Methanosuratincola sp.]